MSYSAETSYLVVKLLVFLSSFDGQRRTNLPVRHCFLLQSSFFFLSINPFFFLNLILQSFYIAKGKKKSARRTEHIIAVIVCLGDANRHETSGACAHVLRRALTTVQRVWMKHKTVFQQSPWEPEVGNECSGCRWEAGGVMFCSGDAVEMEHGVLVVEKKKKRERSQR